MLDTMSKQELELVVHCYTFYRVEPDEHSSVNAPLIIVAMDPFTSILCQGVAR